MFQNLNLKSASKLTNFSNLIIKKIITENYQQTLSNIVKIV